MQWTSFDSIYLINLPERTDRRRELTRELRGVGLDPDASQLTWIPAERPKNAGEFPSIGARGCFLSHLACLKDAMHLGHRRILILEDDACFPRNRHDALSSALEDLETYDWALWYGGGRMTHDARGSGNGTELVALDPTVGVQTSHFVAFQRDAISSVRAFLELILTRPGGHPEAGPMHVDGAYSTWRALNPEAISLASLPPICTQRSSRSDIADLRWFDRIPVVRRSVSALRRLRNR